MALRTVVLEDGAPTDMYPFGLPAVVVSLWRSFLAAPERFLRHLGGSDDGGGG